MLYGTTQTLPWQFSSCSRGSRGPLCALRLCQRSRQCRRLRCESESPAQPGACQNQSEVRVRILPFLLLALPTAVSASTGEHCFIPKVQQGVATIVAVENIEKPFCGVVLLDNRYVRLSEVTKSTDEGPITCESSTACSRTTRYFLDAERATKPYILVFQGPRIAGRLTQNEKRND